MPKVSVNIPCFNGERYIRQTIESVLSQTFSDFELVIVDDGSTDDTSKIINSFSDVRVRYFYKRNEGLASTRNFAFRESKSEFIALLDQDDIWLKDKLEKQLELFKRDKNVGIVFSDAYILDNEKIREKTYLERCKPSRGFIFENLLLDGSNFIPLPTVILHRKVFEQVGIFNTRYRLAEEWELFLRVAQEFSFDYINEPLACYRLHEANFSRNKDIYVNETLEILNNWKNAKGDLFKQNSERFSKKQAGIYLESAVFYALNGKKSEALTNLNFALNKHRCTKTLLKKMILLVLGCRAYGIVRRLLYNE